MPDSGKLGATLAHCMMIRSRCVGNQYDSILSLEWPTYFPRALALRFTARFRGPSTLFTVHRTARAFKSRKLLQPGGIRSTCWKSWCGAWWDQRMRETSASTNVHCPTDHAECGCWFDLDLGFPVGV